VNFQLDRMLYGMLLYTRSNQKCAVQCLVAKTFMRSILRFEVHPSWFVQACLCVLCSFGFKKGPKFAFSPYQIDSFIPT
jgi:hypothetical protein